MVRKGSKCKIREFGNDEFVVVKRCREYEVPVFLVKHGETGKEFKMAEDFLITT